MRGKGSRERSVSFRYIVTLDVGKDSDLSGLFVNETPSLEHLGFQCAHERFSPGIIIGIGSPRHALSDPGLPKLAAKGLASVLAATVAVEDEFLGP